MQQQISFYKEFNVYSQFSDKNLHHIETLKMTYNYFGVFSWRQLLKDKLISVSKDGYGLNRTVATLSTHTETQDELENKCITFGQHDRNRLLNGIGRKIRI